MPLSQTKSQRKTRHEVVVKKVPPSKECKVKQCYGKKKCTQNREQKCLSIQYFVHSTKADVKKWGMAKSS